MKSDDEKKPRVELKCINPVGLQLLRFMLDKSRRLIISFGGSSSAKSYSLAQALIILTSITGDNAIVMRKVGASISKSIYEDFRQAAIQLKVRDSLQFKIMSIVNLSNGARIDFSGLDDPEKIKGIANYRWVFLEEMSEYALADFKQVRKRLRGRAGQQIVGSFNPISESHWIKTEIFDKEHWHDLPMKIKGIPLPLTEVKSLQENEGKSILNPRTKEIEAHAPDTVIMQSTYLNNFWVVGSPDGTYGFYDEQCIADFEKDRLSDPDYYNVYALGEWGIIRTGAEFFSSFNRGVHCAEVEYNPQLPIHLSVDNNRLPYISYTFWQVDHSDGIHLRQIHEICAGSPDNSARKSAVLVAKYLRSIGYTDKVYLHGDCTTRNSNTIDDEGRSFLDKVISRLTELGFDVVDKVSNNNPSVSMSGEFINAILDKEIPGLAITIGEHCKTSIEDYQAVQKDSNGAILKTKVKDKITMQTYEAHGHLSDCFRYIVVDVMNSQFVDYSNKRKYNLYARDGLIRFYNPTTVNTYSAELVYGMPNVGGKFVMVHGKKCGQCWHIVDVAYCETSSTEDIKERLNAIGCSPTYLEAAKSYYPFIRELRSGADYTVKVMPEEGDVDRRIAATSDYVKSSILFSQTKNAESEEYAAFMTSLLDYNKDSQNKEASAVLSGFIKIAVKLFQEI